ncbi:MAG TPA: diaminopimelate decarboxylase [Verrucomicrobiae bacterium]|nr:diaminopimelate decarboxylase [Verrucomicrobiae bacterium]
MKPVPFLTDKRALTIRQEFGTPAFVYDQQTLQRQARLVLGFPNAFGLTARYAMKACPTSAVLKVFTDAGLHIDASSGYEVERALRAGVSPERIQLTAQELPANLPALIGRGVLFNACSVAQIHVFGARFPGRPLSIRINPGLGSGHSNRTNVGGPSASFGIWHAHLPEAVAAGHKYGLRFTRLHTHIGSGSDPKVWERVALMSLQTCTRLPDVTVLNLGGGYKIGRVSGEETTDLQKIGCRVLKAFRSFAKRHGRRLRLEVEPGSYLVASAGALITTVVDVVDTGRRGYSFLKLDAGMTEILRPSMYGAQHPIEVVPAAKGRRPRREYVIVGHCCESGDVLTPAPGRPEALGPRLLPETRIGDLVVIGGAGAYCSSMAAKNYNSFPEAPEVMILKNGSIKLIRKRQLLDQIVQNEA